MYCNTNPIFGPYYDPQRPLAALVSVRRENPHQLLNMTARELFDKLTAPPRDRTYYYYSGNVRHVEALVEDVLPFEVMLQLDPEGSDQNINVWFGKSGH